MQRLEIAVLAGVAIWMNLRWDYFTPRPRHAWHHRATGRARWHWAPGRHRGGYGVYAAAGRAV